MVLYSAVIPPPKPCLLCEYKSREYRSQRFIHNTVLFTIFTDPGISLKIKEIYLIILC